MSDTVGFVGLGTMGMPMTTNLSKAGVPLIVYDTSPTATADARRLAGVTVAESPAQVAAQSDVLFSCLPNNDIVLGVYLEAGGIIHGGRPGLGGRVCVRPWRHDVDAGGVRQADNHGSQLGPRLRHRAQR